MAYAYVSFRSGKLSTGDEPRAEVEFIVHEAADEVEAAGAISAIAATSSGALERRTIDVEKIGIDLWVGTASYAVTGKNEGKETVTFEIGGGTTKRTQSRETIDSYGTDPPDFKGAIGVANGNVEGVEVGIESLDFNVTHQFAVDDITNAYVQAVAACAWHTNDDSFRGFAAGEVLFIGCSGAPRSDTVYEVTFKFRVSPNATGLTVGDISSIDKNGHEYLWVLYAEAVDANTLVKQPIAVYVERVYDEADFETLGIDV